MILNNINDYHKHKLCIPKCQATVLLDEAIDKYNNMLRRRKAVNSKNEYEIAKAFDVVVFRMDALKKYLIDNNLWG